MNDQTTTTTATAPVADTHTAALISANASAQEMAQKIDFAQKMAKAMYSIPKHLRQNVGDCLGIVETATVWGFSPYHVARLCYVVNDVLCYQAQLILAVIEKFAPLQRRLRFSFEGEGDNRVCIVSGLFKGEVELLEYRSPRRADISPKNSPLWKTDPDQQQTYLSVARWGRLYCNAIMIGVHTKEELEDQYGTQHVGFDRAKDVSPLRRLTGTGSPEGFPGSLAIDAALAAARTQETAKQSPADKRRKSSADETAPAGLTTVGAEEAGAQTPSPSTPSSASASTTLTPATEGEQQSRYLTEGSAGSVTRPADPPIEQKLQEAFDRGVKDRADGKKRSNVPAEWREANPLLAFEWVKGFNSVKAS